MWPCLLMLAPVVLAAPTTTTYPDLTDLDLKLVEDVLADLKSIPVDIDDEDPIPPELMDLFHDVDLLWEAQNSNLSETREGKGLLSKLTLLTGLKLGTILTGSGTLAASQSINFLGKVLNAALSVSYGSLGSYTGGGYPIGGGYYPGGVVGGGGVPPIVGLQKLPIIQADVPDDKKREKPDAPLVPAEPLLTTTSDTDSIPSAEAVRKEFLKDHNQRVEYFNNAFDQKKSGARTGRIEIPNFVHIT